MTAPISSFAGLASGIDTKSLVEAILKSERGPLTRVETAQATLTARRKALGTYRGLLDTLRTAARGLRDGTAFASTVATVQSTGATTTKVLGATTATTAVPGTYAIEVTGLARAERLQATGVADTLAARGLSGTIRINGFEVTIDPSDSLEEIRAKIEALNLGTPPAGVSASILQVSDTDKRLILASDTTGAAGMTLADVSGTVLQDLGILDAGGAKRAAAVVIGGADAVFTVDDIPVTRSSNSITDVIAGVTLTLEGEGTASLVVDRYADSAKQAMTKFVEAYNKLVAFLKEHGTATESSRPALYGNAAIRSARAQLPADLLTEVWGASAGMATAADAGLSLTKDGTLSFDAAKFTTAFAGRIADLRTLFTERREASDAEVTFVSSGGNPTSGTFVVDITAAATRASVVSGGFAGTYDAGATPDVLKVVDNQSGRFVEVTLTSGMTSAQIKTALEDAIAAESLGITVSLEGTDLRLTHANAGTLAGISASTTGIGDGTAELFAAPAVAYGTNVAGTIGGHAATGTGELLVGNAGEAAAGLTVRYAGTGARAAGTITLGLGTGALLERTLEGFLSETVGSLSAQESGMDAQMSSLDDKADALEARLERRRVALMKQFMAMETAIARIQSQSGSLASLLGKQGNA